MDLGEEFVTIKNLRNTELDVYVHKIEELVLSMLPQSEQSILEPFSDAIADFNRALGEIGNFSVEELQKADVATNTAWVAIKKQLEVNVNHYDPAIREAAQAVQDVFNEVPDPTKMAYAEEYAQLANLLERLSSLPPETLKVAMVDGWKSELRRRYTAFNELKDEISVRKSNISMGAVKTSRLELYDAYRVLMHQLQTLSILNPDEVHISLVDKIDELLDDNQNSSSLKLGQVVLKSSKSESLMSIERE